MAELLPELLPQLSDPGDGAGPAFNAGAELSLPAPPPPSEPPILPPAVNMSPKYVEMYLIFRRLEEAQREQANGRKLRDKVVEYALYYRTVDDTTFKKVLTTIPNGLILYTQIGTTAVNYNVQRYLRMFGLAIHKFDPGWKEQSPPPSVFAIRVWEEFEAQFDKSNDAFPRDRLILAKTVQQGFLTDPSTNLPETKELKWLDNDPGNEAIIWDSGVPIEFQDWAMIPFNHKFDVLALYSLWKTGDTRVDKRSAKVPSFVSYGGWLPDSYAAEKVKLLNFPPKDAVAGGTMPQAGPGHSFTGNAGPRAADEDLFRLVDVDAGPAAAAPSRKRRRTDPPGNLGHSFTDDGDPLALGDNGTPGAGSVAAVADADDVWGDILGAGFLDPEDGG
jgi:hypothetical protein